MSFAPPRPDTSSRGALFTRNFTLVIDVRGKGKETWYGIAQFFNDTNALCLGMEIYEPGKSHLDIAAFWDPGPNPPPPPPPPPDGKCTVYSAIGSVVYTGNDTAYSGGSAVAPFNVTLYPSWPASSPWITSVGATTFINGTIGGTQMASDQFGSGGGFSAIFNQSDAPWQAAAVSKYLAQGPSLPKFPPAGSFPPHGRATPDLSALGEGYQVYMNGGVESVGGTSASSPFFAGLVSLLNEARLQADKPQMGFLNPFLYQHPDAFPDIVHGTNAIPRGLSSPLPFGFAATIGWDAATGLGTPIFDKLLAAAMSA